MVELKILLHRQAIFSGSYLSPNQQSRRETLHCQKSPSWREEIALLTPHKPKDLKIIPVSLEYNDDPSIYQFSINTRSRAILLPLEVHSEHKKPCSIYIKMSRKCRNKNMKWKWNKGKPHTHKKETDKNYHKIFH